MTSAPSGTFETLLLATAGIAAGYLVVLVPFAGLPLLLLAVGWLVYSGRPLAAALVVLTGALGAVPPLAWPRWQLGFSGLVAYVPAVVAGWWAIHALRTRSPQLVAAVLAIVVIVSWAGSLLVFAANLDAKDRVELREASDEILAATAAGPGGAPDEERSRELRDDLLRLAPGTAFSLGAFAGVLSVAALGSAARRAGASVRAPRPLEQVDLNIHFVWPLIASLGLMAAASFTGRQDGWMGVVGGNLLVVSRLVMLLQGLGVTAHFLKKARVGTGLRVATYLFFALTPDLGWLVAGVGAADLWANFRKLPRGASPAPPPSLEETSGQGLE